MGLALIIQLHMLLWISTVVFVIFTIYAVYANYKRWQYGTLYAVGWLLLLGAFLLKQHICYMVLITSLISIMVTHRKKLK